MRSFDFRDEVDCWKTVHSVNLCESLQERETSKETRMKERDIEEKGIRTMF